MKLRAFIAIALAAAALAIFGPAASAVAYPVTTCSTLSVSTTNPNPGETITVTATGFLPNVSVKLVLRSQSRSTEVYNLKTVKTSAQGSFTTQITLPDGTTNGGQYDLVATNGFDTVGGCTDPFQAIQIGAANAGGGGNNGGSNGGGTAFTGVNVLILLVAAGALIGTGLLLNRRSTSRKLYTGEH
ncbi:MAG: hypothetical protein M3Y06_11475 [Actinomycetota bacterium]|nr:hypothetical protein [Actinomycetota bacterium]